MKQQLLILGLLVFGMPLMAANNPTSSQLQKVEAQLRQERLAQKESERKAMLLTKEVQSVQGQLVNTAQQIQKQENRLSKLEREKVELEQEKRTYQAQLKLSNQQLYRVMKGLQTLALRPTELLIFQKTAPLEMFRSRSLMKYSIPIIGHMRAETLDALTRLSATEDALTKNISDTKQAHTDLQDQTDKINRLLLQKQLMQAQYTNYYKESKKKAEALAAQAKDLKDLLQKLEKERLTQKRTASQPQKKITAQGNFAKAYGHLSWPVNGTITQRYGDQSASGVHAKGIILSTRPNAQIVVPIDGTILFAGPFQNYGSLVIIDHGEGYLSVISGFGRIDVSVGQEVLAGEPIGSMGNNVNLYLELRHQGQAIDPVPWFQKRR